MSSPQRALRHFTMQQSPTASNMDQTSQETQATSQDVASPNTALSRFQNIRPARDSSDSNTSTSESETGSEEGDNAPGGTDTIEESVMPSTSVNLGCSTQVNTDIAVGATVNTSMLGEFPQVVSKSSAPAPTANLKGEAPMAKQHTPHEEFIRNGGWEGTVDLLESLRKHEETLVRLYAKEQAALRELYACRLKVTQQIHQLSTALWARTMADTPSAHQPSGLIPPSATT
ncbi:hypothetical protein BKA70DRAFT_1452915 [Coprinopsis sp. MPI-PUGE-AT-0042]|nr:hypothetical protein BKA70DRAFT_1452915 [Coprinopsis sp. MPI-PUGE-AT-0042]